MKSLPTYHLIYELLSEGKGKLYPDMEPMDVHKITTELSLRANIEFSTLQEVVNWCLEDDKFSEEEKYSIEIIMRIKKIEDRALKKLKRKK